MKGGGKRQRGGYKQPMGARLGPGQLWQAARKLQATAPGSTKPWLGRQRVHRYLGDDGGAAAPSLFPTSGPEECVHSLPARSWAGAWWSPVQPFAWGWPQTMA